MGQRVAMVLAEGTDGIGRHVLCLVEGLVADETEVRVYAPRATLDQCDFAAAGATVVAVEIPPAPGPRDVGVVGQLRRDLRSEPADLIHAHGVRAGLVASLARPVGVPLVVTWHATLSAVGLRGVTLRAVAAAVARAADLTLAVSPEVLERANALGARRAWLRPVAAPRLRAPARSRAEVLDEFGLDEQTPLVLSVGHLHPHKRHDVLLDAAAALRDLRPMPVVLLAGVGPAYRDLAAQAAVNRAPVIFIGQRDDVADLLAAADVAVVTSDGEGSPRFAQEALGAGVPLVATSVPGIADVVGQSALLVPAGDPPAVAAAVRGLLADPARRAALGQAGRARAATWPDEERSVADVLAAYRELLGAPDVASDTPDGGN